METDFTLIISQDSTPYLITPDIIPVKHCSLIIEEDIIRLYDDDSALLHMKDITSDVLDFLSSCEHIAILLFKEWDKDHAFNDQDIQTIARIIDMR